MQGEDLSLVVELLDVDRVLRIINCFLKLFVHGERALAANVL